MPSDPHPLPIQDHDLRDQSVRENFSGVRPGLVLIVLVIGAVLLLDAIIPATV